jgi:mono/diheme cytochrome c family protein
MKVSLKIAGAVLALPLLCTLVMAAERDPLKPRVPEGDLPGAQKMKNPSASSPDTIAKGKQLYEGKGTCIKCHGATGQGDGPGAKLVRPSPRNFTNADWQKTRTDGEMFWVLKNGSPGSGMVALIPSDINEEEAWQIIHYVRTFGKS